MTGTMDFFGHQEAARRATRRLVVLFALAVVAIIAAVYFAGAFLLVGTGHHRSAWNPGLLGLVTLGVLAVVGIAMAVRTGQLRAGGPAVAEMLGGTEVAPGAADPLQRRLLNVVEEMSLASGVPVPRVYVLTTEPGINAFAAGWGTRDAAVAVTQGALEQLDRDELQGVIAHEFSHVFHGDMRMNIRLMGVLFGIVCLSTIGELLLRTMGRSRGGGRNKNGAAGVAMFGLALLLIGWIGSFFAGLIKAAVSRQREYLADAAAVAYTRNPRGIGMALARIGRLGSRIQRPGAREASHMFFADGFTHWLGGLGATHPPLDQRVDRILPGFLRARAQGTSAEEFLAGVPAGAGGPLANAGSTVANAAGAVAGAAGLVGGAALAAAPGGAGSSRTAAALTGLVGTTSAAMVATTRAMLQALPLEVLAAARDPQRAPALLCALLLHPSDATQADVLLRRDPTLAHDARTLATELRAVPRTTWLPLVELLIPALRALPPARIAPLHQDLEALARADGALTTFEFALLHTARRHLPAPGAPDAVPRRALALVAAAPEARLVLSVLAYAGADGDAAAAAAAFARGRGALTELSELSLLPRDECRFSAVERAMTRLEQLSPMGKKLLIDACARVAAADGEVQPNEGELLRAFAASWDCPLPPLWSESQAETTAGAPTGTPPPSQRGTSLG
ncbi:MAG: M48 family metalloprotease [Planctomycetota bacterium]